MTSLTPCLWFDGNAEEAALWYVSLFPDSRVDRIGRAPADYPGGKKGDALMVEFTLAGRAMQALNGGPYFQFTEAISLSISVEDQAELDHYYAVLSSVPEAEQCGWVKDRYGLSWQIVPKTLADLMTDPDPQRARRAMQAMMDMKRLVIADIETAANRAID